MWIRYRESKKMAEFGQCVPVVKEDCVFVDYLPIAVHEEEVTSVIEDEEFVQIPLEIEREVVLGNDEVTINNCDETSEENNVFRNEPALVINSDDVENFNKGLNTGNNKIYKDFSQKKHVSNGKENPAKKHSCYHCKKMFNTQEKMLRHVKVYHKENFQVCIDRDGKRCWVCGSCNKTFISRKGSIIHQRTHTGERPYLCNICSKRFIDSSTLMKHQVIHQAVRPFTCQICKRGFNQKVALQRHERTHSQGQVVYICKHCPKTFLVVSSLRAHEKIHSGVKPFSCNYCQSSFHTSTAQRQHERVHTNEQPYICLHCPKAFKDSSALHKHQVSHSDVKPFVCPLCLQSFSQKMSIRKHISFHVAKSYVTSCSICDDLMFNSKEELCDHLEKHVEDQQNLVEVCSHSSSSIKKSEYQNSTSLTDSDLSDLTTLCDVAISTAKNFNFNDNRTENDRVSTENYDKLHHLSCSECRMGFKCLKSLKLHLCSHSLSCKHCDKVYSDRSMLEEHEKLLCSSSSSSSISNNNNNNLVINNYKLNNRKRLNKMKNCNKLKATSKRQFYCEKCDKYFSSRNGYMIHQRCHTGERPYHCRWCEKAFGDSATRHKHERIHTGERPFQCAQCPRAFNQRAALRAHQVTHSVDRSSFVCPYCSLSFRYAATLKKHCDDFHNDNLNIVCPICDELISDIKSLHDHVKNIHCTSRNPSSCSLCDSGLFTEISEFSDHIVWHARQISKNNCTKDYNPSNVNC